MSASHDEDRLSAETTDAEEASVVDAEVVDAEQFGEALGGEPAESAEETDLEQDLSDLIAQARSERDEYLDLAEDEIQGRFPFLWAVDKHNHLTRVLVAPEMAPNTAAKPSEVSARATSGPEMSSTASSVNTCPPSRGAGGGPDD